MKYPPRSSVFYVKGKEVPRPVFGVDIDGTLGEYHKHFIRFASAWLGREIPIEYDGSTSLAGWCGVSKSRYRRIKLAYRQGGLKRSMPCYPGAAQLTRSLRARGATVVLCTTRPYLQLEVIEEDTKEWLRRNKIQYDNILSGENKYRDLCNSYKQKNIVCVLEDLPEMARQANECNLFTLLLDKPYNHPPILMGEVWFGYRMYSLGEAEAEMLGMLDDYEKKRGVA